MANCIRNGLHYRRHQYKPDPLKDGRTCKACGQFQPTKVIKNKFIRSSAAPLVVEIDKRLSAIEMILNASL